MNAEFNRRDSNRFKIRSLPAQRTASRGRSRSGIVARKCRAWWDGGYCWRGPWFMRLWPKTRGRNLSGDRSVCRKNRTGTGVRGRVEGCAVRRTTGGATWRFCGCRNLGSSAPYACEIRAVAASLRHACFSNGLPAGRKRLRWKRSCVTTADVFSETRAFRLRRSYAWQPFAPGPGSHLLEPSQCRSVARGSGSLRRLPGAWPPGIRPTRRSAA